MGNSVRSRKTEGIFHGDIKVFPSWGGQEGTEDMLDRGPPTASLSLFTQKRRGEMGPPTTLVPVRQFFPRGRGGVGKKRSGSRKSFPLSNLEYFSRPKCGENWAKRLLDLETVFFFCLFRPRKFTIQKTPPSSAATKRKRKLYSCRSIKARFKCFLFPSRSFLRVKFFFLHCY